MHYHHHKENDIGLKVVAEKVVGSMLMTQRDARIEFVIPRIREYD